MGRNVTQVDFFGDLVVMINQKVVFALIVKIERGATQVRSFCDVLYGYFVVALFNREFHQGFVEQRPGPYNATVGWLFSHRLNCTTGVQTYVALVNNLGAGLSIGGGGSAFYVQSMNSTSNRFRLLKTKFGLATLAVFVAGMVVLQLNQWTSVFSFSAGEALAAHLVTFGAGAVVVMHVVAFGASVSFVRAAFSRTSNGAEGK